MKSILVTGGSGFIGSYLCEKLLSLGFKVINLDSFNDYYDLLIKRKNISRAVLHPNYVLIEGDIRDSSLLEGIFSVYPIDTVIHLAALAGVRNSIGNPLEYVDVDIKGTVNLLEHSKNHNIQKYIFASSSSVYGNSPVPFKEDYPIYAQLSPYAAAKQSGELFCQTYHHLYGLPIVALRFFTVYGPRQRPEMAISKFTRQILEGKEITLFGDGTSSRDYTYVDDIVDGIIASIDLKCSFTAINLGNSSPVTLNNLVDMIGQGLGKKVMKKFQPAEPGDMEQTLADTTRSRRLLNFIPKISIDEGITKFISWYLNQT